MCLLMMMNGCCSRGIVVTIVHHVRVVDTADAHGTRNISITIPTLG